MDSMSLDASASAKGADVAAAADPAAVEDLLSKELLQLKVKDRNDLQEEIHGVRCLAPEETPRFVEDSLRKLATELDEVIPDSQKRAYLQSQQRPASAAYVNSREFRLLFLRCELFDCHKAAERMARVCDCLLNLFGRYALERPIKLSDFTNAELKVIRKGRFQIMPFRDRSGRRITILFPGGETLKEKANNDRTDINVRELQNKIFIYMSYVVGRDVESARRGAVVLVWFDAMLESGTTNDITRIYQGGIKSHKMSMLRCSAIHICSPDTHFYHLQRSILSLSFGSMRSRISMHLGESTELRYILNGYGISTDTIPISWTGTVKVGYLKQWLRIRQYLEDPYFYKYNICNDSKFCSVMCNNNNNNNNNNNTSKPCNCKNSQPIECPRLNDILFKKGKSAKNHPGNAHFRSQIQYKYEHTVNSITSFEPGTAHSITQSLVKHFYEEVQKGNMRVLMWNEKLSWWSILKDERLVRKKIENIVISAGERAYSTWPMSPHENATPEKKEHSSKSINYLHGFSNLEQGRQQCFQGVASLFGSQRQENGGKRIRLVSNSMSDLTSGDFGNDEKMPGVI